MTNRELERVNAFTPLQAKSFVIGNIVKKYLAAGYPEDIAIAAANVILEKLLSNGDNMTKTNQDHPDRAKGWSGQICQTREEYLDALWECYKKGVEVEGLDPAMLFKELIKDAFLRLTPETLKMFQGKA